MAMCLTELWNATFLVISLMSSDITCSQPKDSVIDIVVLKYIQENIKVCTLGPLNRGPFGTAAFVLSSEVVLF